MEDIRFLSTNFQKEFYQLLPNSYLDAIYLAESYVEKFPHHRHIARDLAYVLLNEVGLSTAYKRLLKLFIDTTQNLAQIGTQIYNLPPVFENTYSVERIGEIVDQTAMAYYAMQMGLIQTKPILLLPKDNPRYHLANDGFFPYLASVFDIISDTKEVLFFNQISQMIPYFGQLMKVTDDIYGTSAEIFPTIHKLLTKMKKRPFAFQILEETENRAVKFLKSYDFDLKKPFVTLHLREKGYADGEYNEQRNINPKHYILAVNWLLSQGIQVVRIGHEQMSSMEQKNGFVDLTHIKRPGEVDIYLCAKNLFYYGNDSGPLALAYHFGAPSLCTATSGCYFSQPNSLIQFRPLVRIENNQTVQFSNISTSELRYVWVSKILNRSGIKIQSISEQEHLRSVKEMLEFLGDGNIVRLNHQLNHEKQIAQIQEGTYLTSDSLALL
ncbi:hypothetical protein CMK18_20850 [Candidatus Poribacteria bacterium]|nr:hypothetical protein [Candidatus Poribacteria bacterium]